MPRASPKPTKKRVARDVATLHLRIDFGDECALGPGKIRLLELINETGSISAAGRTLKMSYRQAWLLVDELNRMFREPVVSAQTGGGGGGGTMLTDAGNAIVGLYREMERRTYGSAAAEIRALSRLVAAPRAHGKRSTSA